MNMDDHKDINSCSDFHQQAHIAGYHNSVLFHFLLLNVEFQISFGLPHRVKNPYGQIPAKAFFPVDYSALFHSSLSGRDW
jgi:hypothetical protein